MGKRRSALADKYPVGRFGLDEGEVGVRLQDVKDLQLYQVGTWPDLLGDVGRLLSNHVGADTPPKPCRSVRGTSGTLLRVEPLKWWLLEGTPPSITPQKIANAKFFSKSKAYFLRIQPARCNPEVLRSWL